LGSGFFEGYDEVGGGNEDRPLTESTVTNIEDVIGALVFDTWAFNEDASHILGCFNAGKWRVEPFDNDGAFNRNNWSLPIRPRLDMNCTTLRNWVRGEVNKYTADSLRTWSPKLDSFSPAVGESRNCWERMHLGSQNRHWSLFHGPRLPQLRP
jgi:hypothetical protein